MIAWLKRLFVKEEKLVWTQAPYDGKYLVGLPDMLNQLTEDGWFIFQVLGDGSNGTVVAFKDKEVGR